MRVLSGRAVGVKKRNASKWEQAIRCDSTTASVPSRPSRSGQACRVSSAACTIAHSWSPKQPNCGARPAVALSSRCTDLSSGRWESTYDGVTVVGEAV